jgi:hypothetical protein
MRIFASLLLTALALPSIASAEETYAISRKKDGSFHASHRLYEGRGDNLHEVSLCGRPYYVRAATVAWMNYEAEEGRRVGLEFNVGKGWVQVCKDPALQISLADIGVKGEDHEVMRASDVAINRQQRFKHISQAFSSYRNSGKAAASYHSR